MSQIKTLSCIHDVVRAGRYVTLAVTQTYPAGRRSIVEVVARPGPAPAWTGVLDDVEGKEVEDKLAHDLRAQVARAHEEGRRELLVAPQLLQLVLAELVEHGTIELHELLARARTRWPAEDQRSVERAVALLVEAGEVLPRDPRAPNVVRGALRAAELRAS